ncbi:hypothetical protein [Streptomyces tubercidicus]|uniref:hypothetical protein n=1 Tax=Streptomyces tubercidicus TaxID=47759 RepID=UPI0037AAB29E
MTYEPRTPEPLEAPDLARILRANYRSLATFIALRLLLTAVLIATPAAADRLLGLDSFFIALCIPAGMFVFLFTAYRLVYGIRVFQCARVLRGYPLTFHPRVIRKRERWTKYGDVLEVRVTTRGQHGAPLMLAVSAAGHRRWPESTDEGAWVAGDLPFGGVLVLPGNKSMLFMKPAHWDKLARQREQADAERVARAERAGLTRKTTQAWIFKSGAHQPGW